MRPRSNTLYPASDDFTREPFHEDFTLPLLSCRFREYYLGGSIPRLLVTLIGHAASEWACLGRGKHRHLVRLPPNGRLHGLAMASEPLDRTR